MMEIFTFCRTDTYAGLMACVELYRPSGLESGHLPYSRSHAKRLKRKAREQIASGLDDVAAALPAVITDTAITLGMDEDLEEVSKTGTKQADSKKRRPQTGLIGEGKGAPLSKNQRKQVLLVYSHKYITFVKL